MKYLRHLLYSYTERTILTVTNAIIILVVMAVVCAFFSASSEPMTRNSEMERIIGDVFAIFCFVTSALLAPLLTNSKK